MTGVGEIFLSAFIQVLFQQLSSEAMKALARREKIESHFKKLGQSFNIIQAALDDAEEKQLLDKSVKVWLENLRDLAYDLGDVLDEISTRYMIQKSKWEDDYHRTNGLLKCIPSISRFAPSRLKSNYKVMSKIKEITERLEYVVKQKIELGLKDNLPGGSNRSSVIMRLTTSLVLESHVYGRDDDRDAILDMLVRHEAGQNFSVIPIVGMGGIGKTTLAQLVYNNRVVKENFHVKAWACVSEEFDVPKITKTIFKAVTDIDGENMDLDILQVRLQDKLSKSKFLIVLDDVWNESNATWDLLLRPFQFGLPGSKIIVTTRNDTIPSVVGAPRTAYHMKLLTDNDCLALLSLHSGKSLSEIENENSEFREVGQELARRCKGLPLAAKTLGGILASKGKEGWDAVLNSKIWDLPGLPEENKILPVLRLSYHHLPSPLKHLFAYCCIFPKDYEFDKNELVLIWMGEGFLETQDGRTKEELGLDYFDELLSRSFFQRLSNCESLFVMHDLINDLAHFVAGGTCYRLDEKMHANLEYRLPEKVRHTSFLRHEYEVFRKFRAFTEVQGLRTFLPMPVQNSHVWPPFHLSNKILVELVPKLHRLRVLSLSGYFITELPNTICNLIHLRYLNLSGTSIVVLPDSVGDLYNLETLSLCNCRCIRNLPRTLGNLEKLRHLDISGTDLLRDMPVEIGDLKDLQTLPKVVLSKAGGFGLKELEHLSLGGKLSIQELQNVADEEDVKVASLRLKNDLDELQLLWGSGIDNSRNKSLEEEVLNLLEPHANLKKLEIGSYGGLNFPSWVGDPLFRKLSTVVLVSCTECTSLPPLGKLLELRELHIREMPKIKCIGAEFYGDDKKKVPFPKLEILRFSDMPAWEKWSCFDGDEACVQFPRLHQLAILRCQKLTDVSPLSFPVLQGLDIEECNKVVLERFYNLETLSYLKIESIPGITHMPTGLLHSLSALEVLECCACSDLLSLWPNDAQINHLTRLRRLVIAECSQLVSIGKGEMQLPCNLEVLELFKCASLEALPDSSINPSSLKELIIKNCSGIVNFPEGGVPPMLKRLEILSCTALESLPSNVTHLERLEIKDCSSLRAWGTTKFPTDLKKLSIKNCTHLDPVSDAMFPEDIKVTLEELSLCEGKNFDDLLHRLNGFSNLVELYLSKCITLRHFPETALPRQLRVLSIDDCVKLKSLPAKMKSMTSLASLEIRSCPKLESFPAHDLPPNLSSIRIWDSKKFKPLAEWGLQRLRSLTEFSICGGFRDLKLLGEENIFPASLIRFSIARFQELSSLSKVLENLTSLRHLSITNCGKLNDLPSERLLEMLWNLEISQCALLSPKCMRDRGEYWPKISGIPCVKMDGKYVYQQN